MLVDWFDNRTLLACNVIVAVIFCIAMIGMRWAYARLRGTSETAVAFIFAVPGPLLVVSNTRALHGLTTVASEVSILLFYLFCYRAVVRFLSAPGFPRIAWAVTLMSIACMVYFTFAQDRIVARFLALGCSVATLRLLMGITLFRKSAHRPITRIFAVFMLFTSLVAFTASAKIALYGTPPDFHDGSHFATANLFYSIIFTCLIGIFFLAIFARELTAIVERRSQLDHLTGVLNRQGINLRFAAELERAIQTNEPVTILLVDIDHFKAVNDTHGHLAGDEALLRVSRAILSATRNHDLVGRFGGDEFLILLPETSSAQAIEIAERIRSDRSIHLASHPLTLSIGVAAATPRDVLPALIDRADAALYEAKRDGRDCVRAQGIEPLPDPKSNIPHSLLLL